MMLRQVLHGLPPQEISNTLAQGLPTPQRIKLLCTLTKQRLCLGHTSLRRSLSARRTNRPRWRRTGHITRDRTFYLLFLFFYPLFLFFYLWYVFRPLVTHRTLRC